MTIPAPAAMRRHEVTWNIGHPTGNPALQGARGMIEFEATAIAIAYSEATVLPPSVSTPVIGGVMTPVELIENTPGIWNWRVRPRLGVQWAPFHIDVDEPVDLASAATTPGTGPVRVVKGDRGAQGASLASLEQINDETLRAIIDDPLTGTSDVEDFILPRGPEGPYGGTEVTDPQVASMLADTATEVGQLARGMFPSATKASVDYWVAPDGSDHGDGSEGDPFQTIAKAVSMIPDMVRSDHHYTIHLAPGNWGNEELLLEHRLVFGKLTFTGTSGDVEQHRLHRVHVNSVFGDVRFEYITATRTGTASAWWFERATPWMDVQHCAAVAADPSIREESGVIGLLADHGSTVHVRDSEFNGRRYGLRSNYGSRIFSRENAGNGNVFGLGARWGGILSTHGTQPAGETMLTTDSGGIIGHGFGGKVGVGRELCLVESQEATEGRTVRKRWLVRENNGRIAGEAINEGQRLRLTFQVTATTNTLLSMDVQYQALVQNSTGDQFVRSLFSSIVTETSVRSPEATVIASRFTLGVDPEDIIQWNHSGSGRIFYLDVVPRSADARWYGVDVEISNMREQDAPTLIDVSVI